MSFIDEFLDLTAILPRDIVRLLKLIKEVDEKSVETNKKLSDSRKVYLTKLQSKASEKEVTDLFNSIYSSYLTAISLSLTKEEIIKELHYLLFENNLEHLSQIIEKGEKECAANAELNMQSGIFSQAPLSSYLGDSKQSIEDNYSNSGYSIKKNRSFKDNKLLGKKKNRVNKIKNKKISNSLGSHQLEVVQPIEPVPLIDITEGIEQVYCFCKGPSYGNMIECDNSKCPIQWFHYDCVGIKEKPADNEKWFCSKECKAQTMAREEKAIKKKKKKNNL